MTAETLVDPFWTDRFGARGREHTEKDAAYHVEFFAQALDAEDAEVVRRYARWLQTLLTTRGMCTGHIDENFARIGRAIVGVLGPDAELVLPYVAAARTALRREGLAGELEAQAIPLADAVVRDGGGERADALLLVSFLADALALDRPATFRDHVAYLRRREPSVDAKVAAIAASTGGSEALRARVRFIVGGD